METACLMFDLGSRSGMSHALACRVLRKCMIQESRVQFHIVGSIFPTEPQVVAAVMEEVAKEKGVPSSECTLHTLDPAFVYGARPRELWP